MLLHLPLPHPCKVMRLILIHTNGKWVVIMLVYTPKFFSPLHILQLENIHSWEIAFGGRGGGGEEVNSPVI